MSRFENVETVSMIAGSDFTGDYGKVVGISAAGTVDIITAATAVAFGVIAQEAPAGEAVAIATLKPGSMLKVRAGGSISAGNLCVVTTGGEVVAAASLDAVAAKSMAIGIANEDAADDQIFEMWALPISGTADA